MSFDISHLLEHWDYLPGQVVVRKFRGKDGLDKIQLRVDLGVLQMNAEGRPDGKKPFGYTSLLEYHQARLYKHVAAHNGSDEGFVLKPEECAKLQVESLQYHHRYICLLQLEDFAAAIRDTERNLMVFDFVANHAESEDLAWSLRQFEPQLLMVHTRASASQALKSGDHQLAIEKAGAGLEHLQKFFREAGQSEAAERSPEVLSLEAWLQELSAERPLSPREKIELKLKEAIQIENYELAAKLRDDLKQFNEAQ